MPRTPPTQKSLEIGARLKELRLQSGRKQMEVADVVGISRGTLAGIETGAAHPGRATMTDLARFYGVTLDYVESGAVPVGAQITEDAAHNVEEVTLLSIWRDMDDAQRRQAMNAIRAIIRRKPLKSPF